MPLKDEISVAEDVRVANPPATPKSKQFRGDFRQVDVNLSQLGASRTGRSYRFTGLLC